MKPAKRWLITTSIVGLFIVSTSAPAEVNVVPTQTRKSVFVTRLYTHLFFYKTSSAKSERNQNISSLLRWHYGYKIDFTK